MLESIVRRLCRQIGIQELSEQDVLNVIRHTGLNKLGASHVVILASILPALEMICKKLRQENIDWGDLEELKINE